MNKIKINLENFQSIKEAELEFIQGINIIIGEGNSGKTATLRAIKGAILNPKKAQKYIKNGTDGLSVTLNYLGNEITWSRTKKDIKYVVNGEEYLKVGNSNLSDILNKSGFVIDENNKLMNVEGELELPFPFDKSPSDLFKLFEKSIFCVSDSALILKAIKADEDTVNKDKTSTNLELDRFEKKLKAINDLEANVDVDKLKTGKVTLEELFFQHDKLKTEYRKVVEGYKAAKQLKNIKAEVQIPSVADYVSLVNSMNKLNSLLTTIKCLTKCKEEVELKIDCVELDKVVKDYETLMSIKEMLTKFKLEEKKEITCSVDLVNYSRMKEHYNLVERYIGIIKHEKAELIKQAEVIKNLKEQLSEFKVCPLCGQEIKGDLT